MPTFPTSASFPASVHFPGTATFPAATFPSASEVLTLLNVQKLSLPANTPVGRRVQVTDRSNSFSGTFHGVFSDGDPYGGAAKADPTWAISVYASELNLSASWVEVLETDINIWLGGLDNPTPTQLATKVAELFNTVVGLTATSNGASFTVECTIEDFIPFATAAQGNYDAVFVLGFGIVQQLAAPSTEQGGVFVSGGTQDGIYIIGDNYNGRPRLNLLGSALNGESQSITWNAFGFANKWTIFNADEGDPLYYSLSNVATPDLVPNTSGAGGWKNASDDSPASITVTSVTQGELDAGVTVVGAGTASISGLVEVDGQYSKTGNFNSEPFYNLIGHSVNVNQHSIWSAGESDPYWSLADSEDIGGFTGFPGTAFPWQPTWGATDSNPPAPTVVRNDVCAEANWINI